MHAAILLTSTSAVRAVPQNILTKNCETVAESFIHCNSIAFLINKLNNFLSILCNIVK